MENEEVISNVGVNPLAGAGFGWDNDSDESSFFGVKEENTESQTSQVIKEVKDETKPAGAGKKKPNEDNEEDVELEEENETNHTFFGTEPDETETSTKKDKKKETEEGAPDNTKSNEDNSGDEGEGEENPDDDSDTVMYRQLLTGLKDKGFLSIDIPEDEELDDDKVHEFFDQELEVRLDETIKGFTSEVGETGAAFLNHLRRGGSEEEFFEVYASGRDLGAIDIEEEADQERFLRKYYAQELDPEDVEEKLKFLKETGTTEKYAKKFYEKWKATEDKKKADLAEKVAKADKDSKEGKKKFISTINSLVSTTEAIKEMPITKKDKQELGTFLTSASVKIGENKYITPFMDKLNKAIKNPEEFLLLGKLLMNDFDFTDLKKAAETKKVEKIKKNLIGAKLTKKVTGSGGQGKSLADFFPD